MLHVKSFHTQQRAFETQKNENVPEWRSSTLLTTDRKHERHVSCRDGAVQRQRTSSRKMMQPPMASACCSMLASIFSPSPYHLLATLSMGMYTSGMAAWLAMTRAHVVLPVPGGPSNSTACKQTVCLLFEKAAKHACG